MKKLAALLLSIALGGCSLIPKSQGDIYSKIQDCATDDGATYECARMAKSIQVIEGLPFRRPLL